MNEKWDKIKDQLLKLQLPQEGIDPLTFLSPKEWHIENYNGREVLVVAEEIPKYNGSICLVVDLDGKVYRAILPKYEIYQYCSNSFEQFLRISNKYLSIYQERDIKSCEQREKAFRNYIQKIDPTALADEQNMWIVYAEEMGYGF